MNNNFKNSAIAKSILITFVLILFLAPEILAISVSINMNPSFTTGDQVYFRYTLLSDSNENISYTAVAKCPDAPNPMLVIRNITLSANIPFSDSYSYMSNLSESINPQTCVAVVAVLSPAEEVANTTFSIVANSGFNFNINLCKDSLCTEYSKVFVKGSSIYFNYTSSLANPEVSAFLIFPDNSQRAVSIPGSVTASQTGTYYLITNASKSGYNSIEKRIEFGVIQKDADIGYTTPAEVSQTNSNNYKSPSMSNSSSGNLPKYFVIAVIIGLALIITAVILVIRHVKNREK